MLRDFLVAATLLIALFGASGFSQAGASPKTQNQIGGNNPSSTGCEELRHHSSDFGQLADACEYAVATPHTLPNFLCTETVEQYLAPQAKPRTITAELTIEKAQNHYANVTLNGKPQTDENRTSDVLFEELLASTGEFALLFNVFSASSHTEFSAPIDEMLNHARLRRYDFRVKRENNTGWTWFFPNQKINPGYHGSVFVDAASGKISRLVVQVSQAEVDPQTPVSEATTTIDYGEVSIAGAGAYLLPVKGQNISCFQILNGCIRADLTFGNFHKFGSSVRILPAPQ